MVTYEVWFASRATSMVNAAVPRLREILERELAIIVAET
jgi:hypothetical protein